MTPPRALAPPRDWTVWLAGVLLRASEWEAEAGGGGRLSAACAPSSELRCCACACDPLGLRGKKAERGRRGGRDVIVRLQDPHDTRDDLWAVAYHARVAGRWTDRTTDARWVDEAVCRLIDARGVGAGCRTWVGKAGCKAVFFGQF